MFDNSKFDVHQVDNYRFLKVPASEDAGSKSLVCLHGMFGGLSNFDHLIEQINEYSVFVPDIPLYSLPKTKLSISGLTEWLRGFMTEAGIHKPVILGNSMGGHIALEYALQYPTDVRALILTGSSGLLENGFGSTFPRRNDPEYIRQQASLTFYEDLVDDTMLEEILDVVQSPSKLTRLLWIARSTQKHNMEEVLPDIAHPTLLIWGKNDVITPPGVAETFCRKMPGALLKWIDKCGHAPMMERPEQFTYFLKEFLDGLGILEKKNKNHSAYEKKYSHL